MKKRPNMWVKANISSGNTSFINKVSYGNPDLFLKKILKMRSADFNYEDIDEIFPACINVRRIGNSFRIYLPYDLNGTLFDDSIIELIKLRIDAIDLSELTSNGKSRAKFLFFVIKSLHDFLKEGKFDEAFNLFSMIFDNYAYWHNITESGRISLNEYGQ